MARIEARHAIAGALALVAVAGGVLLALGSGDGDGERAAAEAEQAPAAPARPPSPPPALPPAPLAAPPPPPSAAPVDAPPRALRTLVRSDLGHGSDAVLGEAAVPEGVRYTRSGLVMELDPSGFAWQFGRVGEEGLTVVRVSARIREADGTGDRLAGVACGTIDDAYIFFVVPGGQGRRFVLWHGGSTGFVELEEGRIPPAAGRAGAPRRVTAVCASAPDGRVLLGLRVDGRSVAEIHDADAVDLSGFGLVAATDAGTTRVVFDDLAVAGG